MTALTTFKEAHLRKAAARWDDAVQGARRFLCYDLSKQYPDRPDLNTPAQHAHYAKVREFTHLLLSCTGTTRFDALGGIEYGFGIKMDGYASYVSYDDACSLLEFVRFFVGHELLDDGDPGVGYYRTTIGDEERSSDTFVRCGADHPKAQPYFHRSVEMLREEYPDAKYLDIDTAIEILRFYEAKQAKRLQGMKARLAKHGDDAFMDQADIDCLEKSYEESRFTALADAIIAMEEPT